jgi:hypothetical protein
MYFDENVTRNPPWATGIVSKRHYSGPPGESIAMTFIFAEGIPLRLTPRKMPQRATTPST